MVTLKAERGGRTRTVLCACAVAAATLTCSVLDSGQPRSAPAGRSALAQQQVLRAAEQHLSVSKGHYLANGKIHYFQQAAPPSPYYMQPNDNNNGQLEYRSADTSGLSFFLSFSLSLSHSLTLSLILSLSRARSLSHTLTHTHTHTHTRVGLRRGR